MNRKFFRRMLAIALTLAVCLSIAPVSLAAQSPKLNLKSLSLTKSTSFTIRVLNLSEGETASFKSTNTDYVTVSNVATNKRSCEITGKAVGSAKVKVTIKKNKEVVTTLYCKVKVTPKPVSIKFTDSKLTIKEGSQAWLEAIIKPNTANETPVYVSSNEDVVSVNVRGLITGMSPGKATITATLLSTGLKAKCTVVVEADDD